MIMYHVPIDVCVYVCVCELRKKILYLLELYYRYVVGYESFGEIKKKIYFRFRPKNI